MSRLKKLASNSSKCPLIAEAIVTTCILAIAALLTSRATVTSRNCFQNSSLQYGVIESLNEGASAAQAALKENVKIPFHYDFGGGIVIPAEVNGHPCNFRLETGTEYSGFYYRPDSGITESFKQTDTCSNRTTNKLTEGFVGISELKLGSIRLQNILLKHWGQSDRQKYFSRAPKFIGFIGSDILGAFLLTIDYKNKQIIFSDPSKAQSLPAKAIAVPFSDTDYYRPYVDACFNGKLTKEALIETGSPCNDLAQATFGEMIKQETPINGKENEQYGIRYFSLGVIDSVSIGGYTLKKQMFHLMYNESAEQRIAVPVFGNWLLSQFKLSLNYKKRQFVFEPNNSKEANAFYYKERGRLLVTDPTKLSECLDFLDKATKLEPDLEGRCCEDKGEAYLMADLYQQSIKNYSKAIELGADSAHDYNNRGYCFELLGRYRRAIKDYTKSIDLDPDAEYAHRHRAICYGATHNFFAALFDDIQAAKCRRYKCFECK